MRTINTRKDLDALQGAPEYEQFMQLLRGTLFVVQKDDNLKKWVALESNETIEQFGFARSDFEPIEQPVLPAYKPDNSEALQRIAELKDNLRQTDYVTLPDYDQNKPDVLLERQAWRDEIRSLELTL